MTRPRFNEAQASSTFKCQVPDCRIAIEKGESFYWDNAHKTGKAGRKTCPDCHAKLVETEGDQIAGEAKTEKTKTNNPELINALNALIALLSAPPNNWQKEGGEPTLAHVYSRLAAIADEVQEVLPKQNAKIQRIEDKIDALGKLQRELLNNLKQPEPLFAE